MQNKALQNHVYYAKFQLPGHLKEARKGFLLSIVCLNEEILKNDAIDDMDSV